MSTPVDRENFAAWNEEMVRQFNPDAYHNHPSPVVRMVEALRVRALLSMLAAAPRHRVLEVGCGAGNILAKLRSTDLHGIDISDLMVESAKARLGKRATIVKGDAEHLPYPDRHFDRVYCSEVLEHVLDPEAVMKEMRRVVADDGVVAVSVPNEAFINGVKRVLFKTGPLGRLLLGAGEGGYESVERMDDAWHLHAFDRAMLERIASPYFVIDEVVAIPTPVTPIRFAARLRPR